MNYLQTLQTVFADMAKNCKKHAPAILTTLGLAGLGVTVYETSKGAIKAHERLKELHDTLEYQNEERSHQIFDDVKTIAPCMLGAGAAVIFTAGCNIASFKISAARIVTLATSCTWAERKIAEYQKYEAKVKEQIGEQKNEKMHTQVIQDEIQTSPNLYSGLGKCPVGKVPCYSVELRAPFYSTMQEIYDNWNLMLRYHSGDGNRCIEECISVCNFFEEFPDLANIRREDRNIWEMYERIGWNPGAVMAIKTDSVLLADGTPAIAVSMKNVEELKHLDFDLS